MRSNPLIISLEIASAIVTPSPADHTRPKRAGGDDPERKVDPVRLEGRISATSGSVDGMEGELFFSAKIGILSAIQSLFLKCHLGKDDLYVPPLTNSVEEFEGLLGELDHKSIR